ncbi:cellulose biosynthesis protein BcsS, partial [Proteus mirabilis]
PSAGTADWYTGAQQQAVDDSWAVAVDGSASVTSNSSAFGSVTVTAALTAPPTVSGARVRVEGVAGTYAYPGQAVAS